MDLLRSRSSFPLPDGLLISWDDGHQATYSYAYLREHCPCASCRDSPPVVKTTADPFPIYGKGPIQLTGATLSVITPFSLPGMMATPPEFILITICGRSAPCDQCRTDNQE